MQVNGAKEKRYIRICAPGWWFLIILVPVLMAALNTGANLLYLVVGGLLSFIILSLMAALNTLKSVKMTRNAPKAAYRNQPFQVHLRIENGRKWFPLLSARIERAGSGEPVAYLLRLPPRQAAHLAVEEQFSRRGVYQLPAYRLACGFPFGLFEGCYTFEDDNEVLVYPRVHMVRANALERVPSAAQSAVRGADDGDEFYSLRE